MRGPRGRKINASSVFRHAMVSVTILPAPTCPQETCKERKTVVKYLNTSPSCRESALDKLTKLWAKSICIIRKGKTSRFSWFRSVAYLIVSEVSQESNYFFLNFVSN